MIQLQGLGMTYPTHHGPHTVLKDVNLRVGRGDKLGILGRNGAGKSTLIRLISGAERPTTGRVIRGMSISWPLAFGGAFQGSLTGQDNFKFICRIHGVDHHQEKAAYVRDFSELGDFWREPVKVYSSGMRARLAFAISMAVEFDCFLIDEVIAVGDARFQEKCRQELFGRRHDRAMVIVSHDAGLIRAHCDKACVLDDARLHEFADVDSAYDYFNTTH